MLYTCGGDGSFFSWTIGGKPTPAQPVYISKDDLDPIDKLDSIDDCLDNEVKPFKDILVEQFYES